MNGVINNSTIIFIDDEDDCVPTEKQLEEAKRDFELMCHYPPEENK